MVLNRQFERDRFKSDLDLKADGRLEIELARLQSKIDRNDEEYRKQLAKIQAVRGSDPASRYSA
jgi:hypothetical protein